MAQSTTPNSRPKPTPDHIGVEEELRKNNELLKDMLEKMKKTEGRLKAVESKLKEGDHNSSATPSRQRFREVPDEVRVSI